MKPIHAIVCAALLLLAAPSAAASPRQEILSGPMRGQVLGILDGDTLSVRLRVWIGQEVETSVRIDGIDAPEIHGKCERERRMAEAAKEEVISLVNSNPVTVYDVRLEKYAGRVLARVKTADGVDIAQHMIDKGLARPYHGQKRQPWCG